MKKQLSWLRKDLRLIWEVEEMDTQAIFLLSVSLVLIVLLFELIVRR